MNLKDLPEQTSDVRGDGLASEGAELLKPLLQGPRRSSATNAENVPILGVLVGELLALTGDGTVPLVRLPGQAGDAAVAAQSTVDLHGSHIGRRVVLAFEQGDAARPIVMGVLRDAAGWPLGDKPLQVDVDADGHRLVVTAKEQLVLRCGKASITLTKAGKVLVEGSYVLSRSTGVNRIKGGSVQLN